MFNDTITIYNKYTGEDGLERWQRTILHGVHWNAIKGVTVRRTGVASADSIQIVIPRRARADASTAREYMPPKQWQAQADKTGAWTLQPGDTVIKGAITTDIIKSTRELDAYDDKTVITSVDDKNYGGAMAHFDVSGK